MSLQYWEVVLAGLARLESYSEWRGDLIGGGTGGGMIHDLIFLTRRPFVRLPRLFMYYNVKREEFGYPHGVGLFTWCIGDTVALHHKKK